MVHVSQACHAGPVTPVTLAERAAPAAHELATRVLTERAGSSLGSPPMHELTLQAQARPEAVPQLRHHARAALTSWGLNSIAGIAELVSAELLTNAIVASGAQRVSAPIGLHIAAYPGRLVVMVRDGSPGTPRPQPRDDNAVSGRGLQIIETLSADWGCLALARGEGKIVWCLLDFG